MLELKNINFKRDNKVILKDINLILEDNKFYCITGPNGSGKSTLAKIIMGLITPDSGTIYYNGKDITNLSVDKRAKLGIGFAFQTPITFKGLTVYDLLRLAMNKEVTKKDACNILSKVGLCAKEYIDRELNNSLSGGELKRIEIATIIARCPDVSIFDEPEAGIDLWSFKYLTGIFKELGTKAKGTTIVISHQERILSIADAIILLEAGTIKEIGTKAIMLKGMLNSDCNAGGYHE